MLHGCRSEWMQPDWVGLDGARQWWSRWSGGLCQILTLMVISSRHMREDVLMSSVVYLMVIKYVSPAAAEAAAS